MYKLKLLILVVTLAVLSISCSEKSEEEKSADKLTDAISKAKITDFVGFYFVGNYSGNPAVYWYDFEKDKSKVFWFEPDERVIDLLISPDNKSGFFITKRKQRLKSSQPAIEKGRLYRIDFELKIAELITQLEDGIQIIPFWTDNNRFTLVINSIDLTIASYINKNIQVYNRFGKLLSDNTEVFDITKDGYPITNQTKLEYSSPNELFTVIEKNDSIQIKQTGSKKEIKTRFKEKSLQLIKWADDNKLVLLLMKSKSKEKSVDDSEEKFLLAAFDLLKKKTIKIFNETGVNNFRLIGNYLLIDNGIGKNSFVEVMKLGELAKSKIIKINGGCSLRRI
jgi:hypothetical protein